MNPELPLLTCHECDLLQRETALSRAASARCCRCGAVLYRNHPHSLERSLALALAASILFIMANAFPIIGLEVGGEIIQTTLFGAVNSLFNNDMRLVALLVFVTTMLTPVIELAAMIYLLLPLRCGRIPAGFTLVFRALHLVEPWCMLEVFVVGILVALVKLTHIAAVVPGIALWSFGALILLLAGALSAFSPRDLWAQVARLQ
jgi:paraquat-inducible protein A